MNLFGTPKLINYGVAHRPDFPNPDDVVSRLDHGEIAIIQEEGTNEYYVLLKPLLAWTKGSIIASAMAKEAEWVMSIDDFENGWGYREYPFCSNCHRGVYKHDAGKWCPFCGKTMKNPMVT